MAQAHREISALQAIWPSHASRPPLTPGPARCKHVKSQVMERDSNSGAPVGPANRASAQWVLVLTGLASVMVALDAFVVTTALPTIREHPHPSGQASRCPTARRT